MNQVDVAQLEVTCSSTPLYDALTKYFAQRGVDMDVEPPSAKDRIHNDPLKDGREYPGKLTSYQNPPSRFVDKFRCFCKEDEQEGEAAQRVTYAVGYGWGKIRTNPSEKNSTIGKPDSPVPSLRKRGANRGAIREICFADCGAVCEEGCFD